MADEAELIARSQRGDQHSFQLLMERHRAVLSRTSYLMTRDSEAARDVVQETLVQVWKGLPSFKPRGSFRAWMLKVLVNQSRKQYRRKRVPTAPLDDASNVPGEGVSPQAAAEREEEHRQLREALEQLSDNHREVLVLRYFSDLTIPEIARSLKCREGTVKSRLSRAHDSLRQVLSNGAGESTIWSPEVQQ